MLNIVFSIIILIGLGVAAFIVIRKFPQLANLDVNNLPAEKVARKKKEIITKRINEHNQVVKEKLVRWLKPVGYLWGLVQLQFRRYVGKLEILLHHEQAAKKKLEVPEMSTEEQEQKLARLIQEGEQHLQFNHYDQAEEKFIAAIKINSKSAVAYRGLGDTYLAKGALEEARQTYRFILQLEPDDDSVLVKLADIAESQGDLEEAIEYYQQAAILNDALSPRFCHLAELLLKVDQPQVAKEAILQAVELEPQNPKYLDLLIETAIICKDKNLANKGYNDLRLVNPENQKLEEFRHRIEQI
ncbi:MAG: Glycosyl transferase family 2 [Candidatus Magasanikbacteria bacterium GW2011_GWA2_37_8]|uniref:Glycosyl transferase family 2 n=1 Tax=Candidatus Magasanikbacteria bacterium GW2011_GWA2_37_8 TaxID=1619036 RepID=A0A0G0JVQ9_9BACT|nr:MAG: Glycosyl transferase family 2 [Candidatus Magasanikbacteria bacterium GW2011_GWA2_37_8]